ncbi:light-regulated protein, chloroplastic [Actinidia eriantha]|uniref:light-regulated protein, chloroplastic n=1 Tax=Actinidia eriantha TaxID=165200 RepID=UPI00258EAC74|nr:light-regulated protein, chloroplastic [Actinidia eriantha]
MQAALYFNPSTLPRLVATKTIASPWRSARLQTKLSPLIKVAATTPDTPTVDYSSTTSVFPAEACETVGGDACDVEMYPEVKLNPESKTNTSKTPTEVVDREYLEYNNPKTVFPGEACDDLGGEFCEPDYQKGVY